MFVCPATEDCFRARLDHMIDLRHSRAVLASRMPWQQIEVSVAHLFSRQARTGQAMPDLDLFGESVRTSASTSNAGRPRVPRRIMIALLYWKHAFNESDEGVVARWAEPPTWQYCAGQAYCEYRLPCDATTLVKFRKRLGDTEVEALLAQTIDVAVALTLISKNELSRVIVDTTVQHTAVAHPPDSKLLETARAKRVEAAQEAGIELKQTFAKAGPHLGRKAGRSAHARQFKRRRRAINRQRTIVGRLQRESERKASAIGQAVREALSAPLAKAQQLGSQTAQRKAKDARPQLYSFHAQEVACINTGKSRQPYEFGVTVGIATTRQGNLIVGATACHGNPFDGHTRNAQIEPATLLMQDSGVNPPTASGDLGYRGVDQDNPTMAIQHRGQYKTLSEQDRKLLRRRQAIEPIIGPLKQDHRMERGHLKGELGDRMHAVRCAAGYTIRWLLRMLAKQGVVF